MVEATASPAASAKVHARSVWTGRRVLSGTASLPLDLALMGVSGSRKLEGPLVADVVLDSLSIAALPLDSRAMEDMRGKVGADVHVRGSWSTPVYAGRAGLRDGGQGPRQQRHQPQQQSTAKCKMKKHEKKEGRMGHEK